MVRARVEYEEIYTGEVTIFLRVSDNPWTVYYALSVPKGDVGPTTDWSEHGDQPNRLHLIAVGQAVAFTPRALQTPPRDANWRARALRQLKTEIKYPNVQHESLECSPTTPTRGALH